MNQITRYQPMPIEEALSRADVFYRSGLISDLKSAAAAAVKIMAGDELGIPPFASIQGINIVMGKPALSANLMATTVKKHPRYDYKVVELNAQACVLHFYENGEFIGESSFTAADAKAAGTQNMGKFPRNMLFARAISNGVRWFCPDVFNGSAVYTPEELGANDIEGEYTEIEPAELAPPVSQPMSRADFVAELDYLDYYKNEFHIAATLKKLNHADEYNAETLALLTEYAVYQNYNKSLQTDWQDNGLSISKIIRQIQDDSRLPRDWRETLLTTATAPQSGYDYAELDAIAAENRDGPEVDPFQQQTA